MWLSIKPSPKRWKLIDTQRKANAIMANYAQTSGDKRLQFVDVGSCLLNGSGPPPDEYFVADGLHLSDARYARWNELLRPLLTEGPQ